MTELGRSILGQLSMWLHKLCCVIYSDYLSKFEGMTLPGGLTYNGRTILDEANREIEELEDSIRTTYESPPQFYIG